VKRKDLGNKNHAKCEKHDYSTIIIDLKKENLQKYPILLKKMSSIAIFIKQNMQIFW